MSPRCLLLTLIGISLCGPALASERRYDVEVVILENLDTRAGEIERWRPRVVVPEIEGAVALPGPLELAPMARAERLGELPEGFEPLPPDAHRLGGAIDKLRESGRYRVLRHLAWQQPALGEEEAPRIRVHAGEPVTVRVPIATFEELHALEEQAAAEGEPATEADGDGPENAAAPEPEVRTFGTDAPPGGSVQPLLRPVAIHPLDGTIRLVVSRYLHIHTDLYFTTPVEWATLADEPEAATADESPDDADGGARSDTGSVRTGGIDTGDIARGPEGRAMLSYPFTQRRRMRSGELHYLDHPVLGLLIRVDRAEESGGEAADGDAEADGAAE